MSALDVSGRHLTLLLPSLTAGGVGRTYADLANGFVARGARVDFVLGRAKGPHLERLDPAVEVIELGQESRLVTRLRVLRANPGLVAELLRPALLLAKDAPSFRSLEPLRRYLERARPDALLSGKTHANLTAIWARDLARVPTRVVVSERTHLSQQVARKPEWRWRHIPALVSRVYPLADAITSVSDGVSADLATTTGIDRSRIQTLYNPILTEMIRKRSEEPTGHPWLDEGKLRVMLGVGRLSPQKDFGTLLEAFARLAPSDEELRLVIVGEGNGRSELEAKTARLGLSERVAFPGYTTNPYAFMAKASVFVLSSTWEGLPGALIEALACGCPVVSTDCPSGPREILEEGRHGELVPTGDPQALAAAVERVLADPPPPEPLVARAEVFAADSSIERYLRVLIGDGASAPNEWARPALT